jgi:HlyD family secretion protein
MKKRIYLPIIVFLLIVLVLSLALFFAKPKMNPNVLTLYGNVDVRQVDIGFRVPGKVVDLKFEEGDVVRQGDLMSFLDQAPYNNEVVQSAANLDSIKASLINAEKVYERRVELIGLGGVSQEDFDQALANRDQLLASFLQAEASLAIAMDNLAFTRALAPTDGIILTRIREPGTVVNSADPIYTLSVSSPVWIRAYVDEPNLGQVYYGMPVDIYTDINGGEVYSGKVGFISPVAEFTPKSVETTKLRTDLVYRLRIYADNPDRELVQGMPVTVKLKLKKVNRRLHE